jgi:hypothetical protein
MLSITTDNATSDETFIDHIVSLTKDSSQPFDKGLWVRCFAYVMNICVQTILGTVSILLQKVKQKNPFEFKFYIDNFVFPINSFAISSIQSELRIEGFRNLRMS